MLFKTLSAAVYGIDVEPSCGRERGERGARVEREPAGEILSGAKDL